MNKSALLLIDIQNDYFPSFSGSKMPLPAMDKAIVNANKLLMAARDSNTPIIHVKHVMTSDTAPFFRPRTLGAELHESVRPITGEAIIEKTKPNSFLNTGLEDYIRNRKIEHLTICGAMSQMCIDATVRAAVDLGFKVTVACDACAAANIEHNSISVPFDMVHASIMAPLSSSYADVWPTSDCLP
ncbi:cysteine hydrolase family protein [Kiloniella sp.]|uniref:cysteine hydrolase family protein n=1 Tax=Kiloniella sp. TaxID=1938587 RepID=UPI003A92C920